MAGILRTLSLAKRGAINFFSKKPLSVSFEVTYACNAKCKHCHLGGPVEEERAKPEIYGSLCRLIKPVVAQVSGGEPLLRTDIEEIIQSLRVVNRAPYIVLTTNGVLLTKKKYRDLRAAGVDEFSLSLDYPDERHDDFRNIPGLFSHIHDLMTELNGEKDKAITISCVVQKDNYRYLLQLAELVIQWNVKMNFSTYTWLRTSNRDYLLDREDLEEFKEIAKKLLEIREKHHNVFASEYIFQRMIDFYQNEGIPHCQAGDKFFIVNPDGRLSPCGLIQRGYYSQKEMRRDFIKTNQCTACNTSIRANSEKPTWLLLVDNIKSIR
jgi:MoaA/NifB/PqqE/SkfB family radical SAM enzyme